MALDRFGRDLGIAFQLVDDMLDFSARQTELGKSIGDDFRDGKVTLPILLAFARGDEAERTFWRRTLEDMDQRPGDLEHAIALVERHGALAETLSSAPLCGGRNRRAVGICRRAGAAGADRGRLVRDRTQRLGLFCWCWISPATATGNGPPGYPQPVVNLRRPLFGESGSRFDQVTLGAVLVQGGGEALLFRRRSGAHLAHHVYGVDARGGRQRQQMFGHRQRARDQLVRIDQAIEKADLVEPLRGEPEAQRHFHRDRIRQVGDVAVIVAAEQPALCLRHLEYGALAATRRSVRSTSMKPPPIA